MHLTPADAVLLPHIRCVDVHHHYFTPELKKSVINPRLHWVTPPENLPWCPEKSLQLMDEMGVDFTILSFPAISTGQISEQERNAARQRNDFVAGVCRRFPTRFGFFGTVPFLDDIHGVIREIAYVLDTLGANGISLASSYGQGDTAKYLGHSLYAPIWAELDKRHAVVFVHGSQAIASNAAPSPFLGVPITEVPHETFKAAAHLVTSGQKRAHPNIKFILAHLGGSSPFLSQRVAALANYMGCLLTPEEILDGFRSFYYETALAGCEATMKMMIGDGEAGRGFIETDRLLFGTDYPAVSKKTIAWFNDNLDSYSRGLRQKLCRNTIKLFSSSRRYQSQVVLKAKL